MLYKHRVIFNKALNKKFRFIGFKSINQGFKHKTGQFVSLKVNDQVFRCYSIASLPDKLPHWDMFIDITPGGPGTSYLKLLKKGALINTSGPLGNFYLNKRKKIYVFGATGCGIAPLLPMIQELVKHAGKHIYLYWGLRSENDITLKSQLRFLSKVNNNLDTRIYISKPSPNFVGQKGHITNPILKRAKEISTKESIVYLSGSREFINQTSEKITDSGYPASQIAYEACY